MLTIEEIKKELDAGNTVELECIDISGFVNSIDFANVNKLILQQDSLIVAKANNFKIDLKGVIAGYGNLVTSSELKYFRIKRSAPTFDDLIDAAVNAVRDNKLHKFTFNKSLGNTDIIWLHTPEDNSKYFTHDQAQYGIDFINSLYTETFAIESEADLDKVNCNANIKLLNGMYIETSSNGGGGCVSYFSEESADNYVDFIFLKGATVTQKRGAV